MFGIAALIPSLTPAQVAFRSDNSGPVAQRDFFFHWNGFEAEWFGPEVQYVQDGDTKLVDTNSPTTFPNGYVGSSFAYSMTGVQDWNTENAEKVLNGLSIDEGNGPVTYPDFPAYLAARTAANVGKHGGSQFGFGIQTDVTEDELGGNVRADKLDYKGEAIIITFDTDGSLDMDNAVGTFGPIPNQRFENTGLRDDVTLTITEVHVRRWYEGQDIYVDILFYDASTGQILTDANGSPALHKYEDLGPADKDDRNSPDRPFFTQGAPWVIEDGDMLIIAHPTDESQNLNGITSELWSMTFDLNYDKPAFEYPEVPGDPNLIPQHPYSPGFHNTWREDGERIALYRTVPKEPDPNADPETDPVGARDFETIRTVVTEFHRGHLITDNRIASEENKGIYFDFSTVTDPDRDESNEDNLRPSVAFQGVTAGAMHQAWHLIPDYRGNHGPTNWVELSGLSDPSPTVEKVFTPPGFDFLAGDARSSYALPYVYSKFGDGREIADARTGEQLSSYSEHGFGSDVISMPVGNILLVCKVRAGERAIATYDVSDPRRPALLDVMREDDPRWKDTNRGAYEPAVYNNYIVLPAGVGGSRVAFIDYSDPSNLRMHHSIREVEGGVRYVQFQDHRMFVGRQVVDLFHIDAGISSIEHNFTGSSGEYLLPLGNLLLSAENSEQGITNQAAIYAFQAEPDVRSPKVSYHIPADGAVDQHIKSRIGLIIHETLDLTTLHPANPNSPSDTDPLRVYRLGTDGEPEALISGTVVVSDKDVITFTPNADLDYATRYRVVAEGFTDIVGNPVIPHQFEFETQSAGAIWYPEIEYAGLAPDSESIVGQTINFSTVASPYEGESADTLEYRWDFGDGTISDWISSSEESHIYSFPGTFTVRAWVRSENAPDLKVVRMFETRADFKDAGEDGFEPRFEAEFGTLTGNHSEIQSDSDASGGLTVKTGASSGVYWDFETVGGDFDFKFMMAVPSTVEEIPSNTIYSWRKVVTLSEIVDGEAINPTDLGIIASRSFDYSSQRVSGYIPKAGRYRLDTTKGDGPRRPLIDFVDVTNGNNTYRYEANLEDSENITRGTITNAEPGTNLEDATEGVYVHAGSRFGMKWDFEAFQAGSYEMTLRAASRLVNSYMGLFINDEKIDVLHLKGKTFKELTWTAELVEGNNVIELRDSEGSSEFHVDYLDIKIPDWQAPEVYLPRNSSQLALDINGGMIYTVNPDNDTITAIESVENVDPAPVWELDTPGNPKSIAMDAAGLLWVTLHEGDAIRIIDPALQESVLDLTLDYGSRPHDIVMSRDGTRAFISLYGSGQIIQMDTTDYSFVSSVDTGPYPAALALRGRDLELLAARFISPADWGEIYSIAIDPETEDMSLSSTLTLAKDTVSEVGPSSGQGVPNYLASIVINPEDTIAYIASQEVNSVAGAFRNGEQLNHDSTVRPIVSMINLETGEEDFESRIDLNDAAQPQAITFSPDGTYMFIALQGSNVISARTTADNVERSSLSTDLAPQGLIVDPGTNRLFVKNFMSRSVTVHDVSGQLSDNSRLDISTLIEKEEALDPQILLGKQIFYNADDERMSFESYISCASCHQDGGHDGVVWDFTQRGEGLRNTTDLRGRSGTAHGNVHWTANFDEIQDFELDIVNDFDGDGFIEDEDPNDAMGAPNAGRSDDLDALAAYVASLGEETVPPSPYREPDGSLSTQGMHGMRLFTGELTPASGNTLSCMECHARDYEYNNSQSFAGESIPSGALRDVGTLESSSGTRRGSPLLGIDTPTLWGLHAGAPYLHNGSAATIEAVFDKFDPDAPLGSDGAAHNLSESGYDLTDDEHASLMSFLYQIDNTEREQMNSGTWMASWGQDLGPKTADFDGDTISNFQEYLFGGNPMRFDSPDILPKIVFEDGVPQYSFNWPANDPNISYTLQTSVDLNEWTEFIDAGVPTAATIDAFLDSIQLVIDENQEQSFYRLEVFESEL